MKYNLIGFVIFSLLVTNAYASQKIALDNNCSDEVCFERSITVGERVLPLLGTGTFRYWGFRVYTAALYGPEGYRASEAILGAVPKVLVIQYHRSIRPGRFIDSAFDTLSSNPSVDLARIASSIEKVNGSYKKVKASTGNTFPIEGLKRQLQKNLSHKRLSSMMRLD